MVSERGESKTEHYKAVYGVVPPASTALTAPSLSAYDHVRRINQMRPQFHRSAKGHGSTVEMLPMEPWRCEAIALNDFERESLKLVEFLKHLAISFGSQNEAGERNEAEANRWQEFRESILPGDKLWMMTEPASHPEVTHGSACLLITRDGGIVTRFQLYQPAQVG